MTGSLTGPAIGPLIGGIIATFANWRIVFWVQTAMVGLGLGLSLLFVPSIKGIDSVKSKPSIRLWAKSQMEMVHVFTLLLFPDVLLTVGHPLKNLLPVPVADDLSRTSHVVVSHGHNMLSWHLLGS